MKYTMRKFSYWLCFSLVTVHFGIAGVGWLFYMAHTAMPLVGLVSLLSSFGSLVPEILAPLFPRSMNVALALVMLLLVIRRMWLLIAKKVGVPRSFQGTAKVLAYIGAGSLLLGVVVLLLSLVFRVGLGMLAGSVLLPAALFVPWAFFLTEVNSLRKAQG